MPTTTKFLSTLPARGATGWPRVILTMVQHFYPRSPRGERRAAGADHIQGVDISIHAPREGSDRFPGCPPVTGPHFYPRSPRGERRQTDVYPDCRNHFYPRSPRGERPLILTRQRQRHYFYPRSPRGERPYAAFIYPENKEISIHAPREGSDWMQSIRLDNF